MHALNGNISFFKCNACNREWAVKGMDKRCKCAKCKNPAVFIRQEAAKKKADAPKGGRGGKVATLVEKSTKEGEQRLAGGADAVMEKDAEKREQTIVTSEGHVIDKPEPEEEPPLPDTPYRMPSHLYMENVSGKHTPSRPLWNMLGLGFIPALYDACFEHTIFRYTRFQLVELKPEVPIPDMRPDYMFHSKMKHSGRKAVYRATQLSSLEPSHVSWLARLAAYVFGYRATTELLEVDAEIFSQVAPSVRFEPAKHAIDRIENSVSRLATVNVDRHDSYPYIDSTKTLLKAYHWHHTYAKIKRGYFSPYELTGSTRW
jgi:hypothetical protein